MTTTTLTTLRVRIPLDERPELEKRAIEANENYRDYLADVLVRAAKKKYRPTSVQHRRETRLPLTDSEKRVVREAAHDTGLDAEDYAMAVYRDLINGNLT